MRRDDGGRIILSSRLSKGWVARVEKTLTSAEFPGTAILWEESYFEVVAADPLPQGGVRYVLEPWADRHAMRVTDRYDADSEALRAEEYRKSLQRESQRKSAGLLAVLTGHLPAVVQQEMAQELGIMPARVTMVSVFGVYAVIAAIVLFFVHRTMQSQSTPLLLAVMVGYLGIENTIRFHVAWSQGRPIGSAIGWIVYALYHAITRHGPSPFAVEKGAAVVITDAPEDVAQRDALAVREAFVTLLTPAEQARVAERFGYDYRHLSRSVALAILVVALVGIASSVKTHAMIATLWAAALAVEQILRLMAFRRGPASSVLRWFVRPFMRKLLR
jgi:hypothetical protein